MTDTLSTPQTGTVIIEGLPYALLSLHPGSSIVFESQLFGVSFSEAPTGVELVI